MNKKIKQILDDLYLIDQDLRSSEKELVKIIQELLVSKPDVKADQKFIKELRAKIVEKSLVNNRKENMFNFLFNRRIAYVFAGAILFLLIAGTSTFLFTLHNNGSSSTETSMVKNVGDNAFGEISFVQSGVSGEMDRVTQENGGQAYGMGGGGGLGVSAPDIAIAPPIDIISYKYVYTGDDFSIGEGKITVYKEAKGSSLENSLSGILSGLSLNGLNLGSFGNKKITSIQISEDKDLGYSIYADPINNVVSISINWERWPMEFPVMENGGSSVSAISDEKAISIADSFLSSHGISVSGYGKGEVLKLQYKGLVMEDVTVVYPLQIEGKPVYDESGQKYGLYVNVSSRYNKVMNASNITSNSFDSSEYDADIDEKKAIEIAEQGGIFGNYYAGGGKTASVELGTPEVKLVKVWVGSNDKFGASQELFIPALVFPVTNNPEWTYYYRNNVIVPLVGGSAGPINGGPIKIMDESVSQDISK